MPATMEPRRRGRERIWRHLSPAAATQNVAIGFPRDLYPARGSSTDGAVEHDHSAPRGGVLHSPALERRSSAEDRDDMKAADAARADAREHGTISWEAIRDEISES